MSEGPELGSFPPPPVLIPGPINLLPPPPSPKASHSRPVPRGVGSPGKSRTFPGPAAPGGVRSERGKAAPPGGAGRGKRGCSLPSAPPPLPAPAPLGGWQHGAPPPQEPSSQPLEASYSPAAPPPPKGARWPEHPCIPMPGCPHFLGAGAAPLLPLSTQGVVVVLLGGVTQPSRGLLACAVGGQTGAGVWWVGGIWRIFPQRGLAGGLLQQKPSLLLFAGLAFEFCSLQMKLAEALLGRTLTPGNVTLPAGPSLNPRCLIVQ